MKQTDRNLCQRAQKCSGRAHSQANGMLLLIAGFHTDQCSLFDKIQQGLNLAAEIERGSVIKLDMYCDCFVGVPNIVNHFE